MEMYQVEIFAPDSEETLMERLVAAENEDEAITMLQAELDHKGIPYGICMARCLMD